MTLRWRAGRGPWSPDGGRFRRVLLLADGEKDPVVETLGDVRALLEERGLEVEEHANLRALNGNRGFRPAARPDLAVVLGGDGSVLTAAHILAQDPIPTIGINFGRVGFLASVEASQWRAGLIEVLEGRSLVEPRMRLEVHVLRAGEERGEPRVAMNDVVISRGAHPSMVGLELRSAGERVSDYRADGLIFATPSGSTAYSLAAGGPILDPAMQAIVVTPISAHALSLRPLVLDPESELEVELVVAAGEGIVVVDGRDGWAVAQGDLVRLAQCEEMYPLLTLAGFDPWRRLRDRLGWRGSFMGPDRS